MKKGQMYSGIVTEVRFPNKGIVRVEAVCDSEDGKSVPPGGELTQNEVCTVKNVVKGQRVSFVVNKKKGGKCEGRLVEVLERSPDEIDPPCRYFGVCGGCTYQNLPYDRQLELKERQVRAVLSPVVPDLDEVFEGIKGRPVQY